MPTTHHCKVCRKNGFCESIKSTAPSTRKYSTTDQVLQQPLRNVVNAIVPKLRAWDQSVRPGFTATLHEEMGEATLIAVGGYKAVWLVKPDCNIQTADGTRLDKFIIRLPCDDALLPNQILNEVAYQKFIARKLPHIPVPEVYYYQATAEPQTSFIVEEYVDGAPLHSIWTSFTEAQKQHTARSVATILVDLSQVQFDMIGGLEPSDLSPAPTVEGCKLFKGRGKFHKDECYFTGPYKTTKQYILASYDREIYYHRHASSEDIDEDLFTDVSVEAFVDELVKKREALAATDMTDEPFTLIHGDFHGRNILMRGDTIAAIID